MTLSQATLVQRVRYELGDRPWETTGSAASSSSVVAVADGTDWSEGDIGEFVSDGDTFWVQSINSNDLTAVRSYWGSTGASHGASSRILKNPRYTYMEITNAIASVISERLWPHAWKKISDSITPSPTTTIWYDLAADALALIRAVQAYGSSDLALGFYGIRHTGPRIVFERNLPTTHAASGVGLQFPDGFYHESNTVTIDYAAKITSTVATGSYSDLTDGTAVVEAIIYGAASHLEAALENRKPRKPRQDRETLRGASMYETKFQDALKRATLELKSSIPLMSQRRI
jgi:hypothetical protein